MYILMIVDMVSISITTNPWKCWPKIHDWQPAQSVCITERNMIYLLIYYTSVLAIHIRAAADKDQKLDVPRL